MPHTRKLGRRVAFILLLTAPGLGAAAGPATTAALPPLTPDQRTPLATADPRQPPDQPAWYGLLANVADWNADAVARLLTTTAAAPQTTAAATTTAWQELVEQPQSLRGELFWIDAATLGRTRRVTLQRPGPWGRGVTEWGVRIDQLIRLDQASADHHPPVQPRASGLPSTAKPPTDATTRSGRSPSQATRPDPTALIYWVNPDGVEEPPGGGEFLAAVRFVKWWEDRDAAGRPVRVPVFVGRWPQPRPAGMPRAEGHSPPMPSSRTTAATGLVALVFVLAAGLVAVRWWVRRAARSNRLHPASARLTRGPRDTDPDADRPAELSQDPAEALGQLAEPTEKAGVS